MSLVPPIHIVLLDAATIHNTFYEAMQNEGWRDGLPTNALLAREFLEHFDGMSIGSNDMTQLALGLDRDSAIIASLFDERDPAVKSLLSMAIRACKDAGKYIGICGQGPSDHPDLARWLVDQGIDSLSLNPDTVVETWLYLASGGKT